MLPSSIPAPDALGALFADPPTLAETIEKATAAIVASTRKIAEAEQRVRDGEATLKNSRRGDRRQAACSRHRETAQRG